MSHMLISGDFEAEEEDEEIVKLLENPLLKFGVKDIAHRHVKEFTPLPSGLVGLAESSR